MPPSASTPCLKDLNRCHAALAGLFRRHQESLLSGDLAEARSLFQAYERGLLSHIRGEDEVLLPLYRKRAVPPRGGAPEHFIGEHQRIAEWLGRLRLRLSRLGTGPGARLSLLDDEAFFKRYLEHHSLREDRILYPLLDRLLTPREKTGLVRRLPCGPKGPEGRP